MNIDEYRAIKAQLEADKDSKAEEQPHVQADEGTTKQPESTNTQTEQTEPVPSDEGAKGETQVANQAITIDGEEVTLDQIKEWQKGHMRQSDYTKKTQELANQRKEAEQALKVFEAIKADPELAGKIGFDPKQAEIDQLQNNYYDLLLQQEVDTLSKKYDDFEVRDVLSLAREKQITNLEDAYLLNKALNPKQETKQVAQENVQVALNPDELKEQIRKELLAELQAEQGTQTLIRSQSTAPVVDDSPKVSPSEMKVAKMMGLTDKEYATWRDKKRK